MKKKLIDLVFVLLIFSTWYFIGYLTDNFNMSIIGLLSMIIVELWSSNNCN